MAYPASIETELTRFVFFVMARPMKASGSVSGDMSGGLAVGRLHRRGVHHRHRRPRVRLLNHSIIFQLHQRVSYLHARKNIYKKENVKRRNDGYRFLNVYVLVLRFAEVVINFTLSHHNVAIATTKRFNGEGQFDQINTIPAAWKQHRSAGDCRRCCWEIHIHSSFHYLYC
ncbi:hypothetical protein L195_g016138 [Trifolium pratense]|uniref:Uncharacterized protein n=1 Tax=Trifolium pratense TaxID=57577 RepID=A0A2K3MQD4_TRIPR|nr:hypothetical protein L195_g016135 [Trifolium pratense]PNX92990.1 hypothetical protein L195_g016138 [Trifolium pratense]